MVHLTLERKKAGHHAVKHNTVLNVVDSTLKGQKNAARDRQRTLVVST